MISSGKYSGISTVEDAAIDKPVDDVSHIGSEESVLPDKAFIVDLFQGLEVVHALIQGGGLWLPGSVGRRLGMYALRRICFEHY